MADRNEPLSQIKSRRDGALAALSHGELVTTDAGRRMVETPLRRR